MPRAPINGDQWYKNIMDGLTPQRSVSYVYQNNAWVEAPCCVGFQPAIGFPDSDVGLLYFGESPITRQIVVPPSATGIFVWNQYTLGVGSWTAATDFDAANFIGVGASGLTAGSLPVGALDGMTRPPINGDQWYNVLDAGSTAERSIDFIYKNGGWTGVPCCVAYDDPSVVTNNIGTVYVGGDPAHKVVQPPTENTGTYLWQQNVTGPTSEGLWVPATSPYVSLVNTGATADIGATGNLPYILIGSSFTGANAISFTSISDNSTLFNGTDTIIINEPGDYLITTNMLIFGTLNSSTGVYSVFASVYVNDMLNDQIVPYVSLNSISLGIIFTNNIVFSNTLQLNNSDTLKLGYYTQIVGSGTGINIYTASMQIKKFAI